MYQVLFDFAGVSKQGKSQTVPNAGAVVVMRVSCVGFSCVDGG